MKTVSKLLWIAGVAGFTATAPAQVLWFPFTVPADRIAIPDGDINGMVLTGTVSGFDDSYKISTNSFQVELNLTGDPIGGNGDIYAALQAPTVGGKSGPMAILLNRPGVAPGSLLGYQDNGGLFTFYEGANDPNHVDSKGVQQSFTDAHFYQNDPVYGGQPGDNGVSGIFRSDGRDVDPTLGTAAQYGAATRTKTLAAFDGLNPNGQWTLFIADVSSGGSSKITSWGLDFTPIPEPSEYALAIGIGLVGFALYRRRTMKLA